MSIQGLQITNQQIRYVFPKDIRNIAEFVRVHEIKKKLKLYFQQFAGILPNFPYRARYPTNANTIFFQCTFCPNQLVYQLNREKGKYELKKFCVDHVHGINFDNQEVRKNEPVEQFPISTENISQIIREKSEKLREPLALHLDNKKKPRLAEPNSFGQLLKTLKKENYYVSYAPQNFEEQELIYPDFLFISSEEMKKTYLKYARCVGFDFTYSLIKEAPLTKYGKREYMIGIIAGLNSYRRIGIYALVVANEESGEFVEKAFTQFIKYMQRQPESIVTDQSLGMLAGMRRIKQKGVYKGNTFWDTFHVLKTYKFRNKILKGHMRKMIRVKCKYQFHKMYLEAVLMARTEEEMDAIHKFMHEAHKYCISQIPPNFIGLGVSDSHNEMVNNLIKNEIPYESKYIKVIHRVLAFIEQRNLLIQMMTRQTCRIDEVVNNTALKIIRHSLCKTVYSFLFIQICKCCKLDLIFRDSEEDNFYSVQDLNTVHYVFKTHIQQLKCLPDFQPSHIKDGFKCSCQFQEKTGIPCEHILKVIFETDSNFIDRIDQYWVVEDPNKLFKCISNYGCEIEQKVKKRGRPQGRPTLFYNPSSSSGIKLPEGISTFEPIKPRGQSHSYLDKKKEMQFSGEAADEEGEENGHQWEPVKMGEDFNEIAANSKRAQMIKNFFSKNE